ncbi:Beta-glucuronidase [Caligus rogercresseyi]|uniref:Beta-glucuronidase n=1 Tax=Caligus rogercresseyi TaxID=217165 RepID=A0A7T8K9L8_CALRO|nr:Beta-glucuronidase [Caligus rogercresseyi]
MTEYGADTLAGYHQDPSFLFNREYQVDTRRSYFQHSTGFARKDKSYSLEK